MTPAKARSAFLYIACMLLLCSIPMGVLSAFYPELAAAITAGAGGWLSIIPDALYSLLAAALSA